MEVFGDALKFIEHASTEQVLSVISILAIAVLFMIVGFMNRRLAVEREQRRLESTERTDSARTEKALIDVIGTFAEQNKAMQSALADMGKNLATQSEALSAIIIQTRNHNEALDGFRREYQTAHGATLDQLSTLAKTQREGFAAMQESFERATEATNGPLRELKESVFRLGQDMNASNEAFMKRIINLSNQINVYAARTVRQAGEMEKSIPLAERDGADVVIETEPEILQPIESEVNNG